MNELQVFDYEQYKVRTMQIDGQPWWVLKDVCSVLNIKNTTQAARQLDEDERAMLNIGRQGRSHIINESGLYSVMLRSDKAEAKKFKRWITHEILPTIRKTGTYQITPADVQTEIATIKQELLEIKQAIMALTSVEHLTIPSSKAFVKCNTKVALRKSYINYLLTVLEQLIGISRMEMLHQAYQTLERETNINLEKAKQEYINKYNKLSVSTLDAICDHEQATKILIQILHFNMELQIAD